MRCYYLLYPVRPNSEKEEGGKAQEEKFMVLL